VNSKRSLLSNEPGIASSKGIAPIPKTEIDIWRMETMEKGNQR
jgi:hypothetical protein